MRNLIRGAQWHLVITGNLREDLVAEDIEGRGDPGADLTWGEPAVGVSRGGGSPQDIVEAGSTDGRWPCPTGQRETRQA